VLLTADQCGSSLDELAEHNLTLDLPRVASRNAADRYRYRFLQPFYSHLMRLYERSCLHRADDIIYHIDTLFYLAYCIIRHLRRCGLAMSRCNDGILSLL